LLLTFSHLGFSFFLLLPRPISPLPIPVHHIDIPGGRY
jgi:hypothetical protein